MGWDFGYHKPKSHPMDLRYNIRLLKWAYEEVNAEDPKEIDLGLGGKVA